MLSPCRGAQQDIRLGLVQRLFFFYFFFYLAPSPIWKLLALGLGPPYLDDSDQHGFHFLQQLLARGIPDFYQLVTCRSQAMSCAPKMMHQTIQVLPNELRKEPQLSEVDVCKMISEPACEQPGRYQVFGM